MTQKLHDWLTIQAAARPDATAVVMGTERLTYRELNQASDALAHRLTSLGVAAGDRVCLVVPKSPAAVVGILASLKAQAIYVPLDSGSPVERAAKMIGACRPKVVLATPETWSLADACRSQAAGGDRSAIVCLKSPWESACVAEPSLSTREGDEGERPHEDAAYILFTSGSTGQPKGVVITHANVIHYINWAVPYFGIDASDRISGHPPLHFDLSMFDLFGALAAGAELHLVPPEYNLLPTALADFIRHHELTQWFSVPSVFNYMAKFDVVRFNDFPSLKRLLWCGEVLPTPVLMHWMTRLPGVRFTNLYGPTEATIASSYYTIESFPSDPRAPIPIGRPCAGEELAVLNEALEPVAPGEVGDLYIGGVGLSPGYWRDPDKTNAVFLPHPVRAGERLYKTGDLARRGPDGLVYFLGRADTQIKSRGYRIELGEIEAALAALSSIREAAVVAIPTDGFEGAMICCAYVAAGGADATPAALRKALGRALPSYMLPVRWRALDALPKNGNGKIDRPRVRDLFTSEGPALPASLAMEAAS